MFGLKNILQIFSMDLGKYVAMHWNNQNWLYHTKELGKNIKEPNINELQIKLWLMYI